MRRSFFLLILFLVPTAFGISKVGNSLIGSKKTGFQTVIPYPFVDYIAMKNSGIKLRSVAPETQLDPNSPPIVSFIEAKDFDEIFDDLKFETRESAREWYLSRGWSEVTGSEACVALFTIENQSMLNLVSLWGPDKGAVFYGLKRSSVKAGLNEMAHKLRLDEGACEW